MWRLILGSIERCKLVITCWNLPIGTESLSFGSLTEFGENWGNGTKLCGLRSALVANDCDTRGSRYRLEDVVKVLLSVHGFWVKTLFRCGLDSGDALASFPLSRAWLWSLGVLGRSVVVFSSLTMLSFGGVVTYVLRFPVLLGSLCKRATSPSCIAGRVLCLVGSLYINRAKACFESYPETEHAVVSQ